MTLKRFEVQFTTTLKPTMMMLMELLKVQDMPKISLVLVTPTDLPVSLTRMENILLAETNLEKASTKATMLMVH